MDFQRADRPPFRGRIILVLAALIANALLSYRELGHVVGNDQSVIHTLQVIGQLDGALSAMKDAENGQRGYLITRDAGYLQLYRQAVTEVTNHVHQIAEFTADDPYQQNRIPAMQQFIQERLAISQRTIELEQEGKHEEARQIVADNLGKQRMDQLRDLISDMRSHEEGLLAQRTSASKHGIRTAGFAFTVAWLVAIFFVMAFFLTARREVQERAESADVIRDKETWLRTTLHSIGDGVIATDAAGTITFINRVAEKLVACTSAQCEGKPLPEVFQIFNELTGAPAMNPVESVIAKRAITGLANHTILRNLEGKEIPIEDSAAPILDANGNLTGVVLVFRDVSRQRKVQEIARTSEKLAATGRLAATIAHEINNPLEAAINLLYLAQNSTSHEEIQRHIASADHELSRMAHITRKTLAFHRSSSVATPTNVWDLLEEVVAIYDSRIASQHISVEVKCDRELVVTTVRGDLVQIVSNLVANALDAVAWGGRLKVSATPDKDGATLEFEDNGSGIPAENLDKVFEPFFTTKKDTGTGLGLWVVKDLVDKLGGKISVSSLAGSPRHGTRFSLFLPSLTRESMRTKVS